MGMAPASCIFFIIKNQIISFIYIFNFSALYFLLYIYLFTLKYIFGSKKMHVVMNFVRIPLIIKYCIGLKSQMSVFKGVYSIVGKINCSRIRSSSKQRPGELALSSSYSAPDRKMPSVRPSPPYTYSPAGSHWLKNGKIVQEIMCCKLALSPQRLKSTSYDFLKKIFK